MHLDWWTIGLQTVNFASPGLAAAPLSLQAGARHDRCAQGLRSSVNTMMPKATKDKAKAHLAGVEAERAGIAAEREAALKAAAAQAQEMAEARRARGRARRAGAARQLRARRWRQSASRRSPKRSGLLSISAQNSPSGCWRKCRCSFAPKRGSSASSNTSTRFRNRSAMRLPSSSGRQFADGRHGGTLCRRRRPRHGESACATCSVSSIAIAFEVNPELIAGAELHFPTAVLRFSWQKCARRRAIGGRCSCQRSLTTSTIGCKAAASVSAPWRSNRGSNKSAGCFRSATAWRRCGDCRNAGLMNCWFSQAACEVSRSISMRRQLAVCCWVKPAAFRPAVSCSGTGKVARVPVGDAVVGSRRRCAGRTT